MIVEWWRSRLARGSLQRRISEEIAGHIEEAAREFQAAGLTRRAALREAEIEFGDRRRIAQECLTALEERPPALPGLPRGISRGGWVAAATAAPVALAYLLIPHHLSELPGRAPEDLVISRNRAVAAYAAAGRAPLETAAFQRAAAVVSEPGGSGSIRTGLNVSANFFEMQDVAPALGSGFSGRGREVILSDRLWRSAFDGDSDVEGRTATIDGVSFRIAGVAPREYWFLTPGHSFWVRTPRTEKDTTWGTLLARRRVGESLADAEQRIASHSMLALHANALIPLEQVARVRLRAGVGVAKGSLWLLSLLGAVQVWSLVRSQCERRPSALSLLRYYAFLFAKAVPVVACLTILWLAAWDSGAALSGYFGDVWAFVSTFLFALSSVATAWQSLVDQRLRCHVCLRRLAMPLPTGVIGSVLFDSAATEYICTHGHGALRVPHPALEQLQPPLWREPERWCLELAGSAPMRG